MIPRFAMDVPASSFTAPEQTGPAADRAAEVGGRPRITYVDSLIVRTFVKQTGAQKTPCHDGATGTQQLPIALECNLSDLPTGYARVALRGHLILFETATRRVIDVMPHAFASTQRTPAST